MEPGVTHQATGPDKADVQHEGNRSSPVLLGTSVAQVWRLVSPKPL